MKHLKSSFADLHKIVREAATARYLTEPFVAFDAPRLATDVRRFMVDRDYDVVGVRKEGIIVGYVQRSELSTGQLKDYIIEFDSDHILNENAPLDIVLACLKNTPRVFVRILDQVMGIITKGDLQKVPVRMWLFGLLSLLEMQLLRLIRQEYPSETWSSMISKSRLEKARSLLEYRRSQNEAIDLADCLQFCDKRTIVEKSPQLLNILQINRSQCDSRFKELESLRNELAHSQDILVNRWPELVDLGKEAERMVQLCEEVG